ncbi:MAG: DUF3459 domain-containing protein [Clostridia bacterium]|nr:DUF3459 domain-containing protein [Clostridia bacterium]
MRFLPAALLSVCLLCTPICASASGVIYEIFPGSFADANGDGHGDLAGVTAKADYIASLGVSAVWLTPIYPSPSYHGYDVTDYCAIHPAMGTMDDFDAMLDALHQRGLSVYLDLVLNHTSSEHPWFTQACTALAEGKESRFIDYYNFSTEPGANMHAVPGADGHYHLGEFTSHMPDLNLDSEAVREEIRQIAAFWLARGVDGFRLDATTHYYGGDTEQNTAFLTWLMATLRAIKPDVYVVGEAWTDDATISRMYDSSISSLFHFSLADSTGAIATAVREQNGAKLARTIAAYSVNGTDAPFLTNHDMGRSAGVLMNDAGKMRAAAAAYLLAPGRPTVYYGEEIGMNGSGRDENKRLPMLWGEEAVVCNPPEKADQKQRLKVGVLEQEADESSLLNTYRKLIALRNRTPEIDAHAPQSLDLDVKALYAIQYGDVTVVVNMGKKEASCAFEQEASIEAIGSVTLDGGQLTMEPWSAAVLRAE